MESSSSVLFYLITGLPLAGLALLALFLFSLSFKKDRFIIPATVLVFLALAGWGTALEYGHKLKGIAEKQEQTEEPEPEQPTTYDDLAYLEDPDEEDMEGPDTKPARNNPGDTDNDRLIPAPHRRRSISRDTDRDGPGSSSRRIIRTRPTTPYSTDKDKADDTTDSRTAPAREPEPEPEPRTRPSPGRDSPSSSRNTRNVREPVRTTPSTPSRSGKGTLVVKIKGPILETSKKQHPAAHINIIVDGKHVKTVRPSRTKEDRDRGGELRAITYFWENISVSFSNLEPGWHVVQIDTSLQNPRSHRSRMLSSAGQSENDYNGQVKLPDGGTATMQFSTKNWNTGQLIRMQ
jgi:hypothetical protein